MMIRKLALMAVVSVAALAGCATYGYNGQGAYGNANRGDYYYGYGQPSTSVGVSVGSGYYGYGSPYGYYGNGYYPYGYSSYPGGYRGYPYYGNPRYNHPRPRPDDNANRGPERKPGWRDLDNIRDRAQQERANPQYQSRTTAPPQRVVPQTPRYESRPAPRGAFSGAVERASRPRAEREIPVEP